MHDCWGCGVKTERRAFWGRVFAANDSTLRKFLRRRVAYSWDIQDLAQEVYLRMLRIDEKRMGSITNPRAYLFTVASNLVKEHAVMQGRRRSDMDIDRMLSVLASAQGTAEDETEKALRRRRLSRTLDRLPP